MSEARGAAAGALARLAGGKDLSFAETEALFGLLMDGELSETLKAALLTALAVKGETVEEVAGAASAMRRRVIGIPSDRADLLDTCGTGGDGKGTFNISTAAALVAAAAGVPVAKHGNRSISSRSGSADVLAALGVAIDLTPAQAAAALDRIGIAFLFAPKLHPAMREVMPVRRELGFRTIFNILGPLTNPAGARRQVLGVYADPLVDLVAGVLARLGSDHALVVHGSDGLDELTTTGPSRVAEVKEGRIRTWTLEPGDVGVPLAAPEDLGGGDPEENAAAMLRVLDGEEGPLADVTILNAGAAIWVGGRAAGLAEGVAAARDVLASGAASRKLDELREVPVGPPAG